LINIKNFSILNNFGEEEIEEANKKNTTKKSKITRKEQNKM
jgi:hypothetical protein